VAGAVFRTSQKRYSIKRRLKMIRKLVFLNLVLVLVLAAFAAPVAASGPNFGSAIYADGQAWGTKGLGSLPAPNGSNDQSFDMLFAFTNGVMGQLPVSEAGPGNPNYNGGRWSLQSASWVSGAQPVLITSYDQLMMYVHMGSIEVVSANTYFLCPLLPVK
jgi:hypothetical protein